MASFKIHFFVGNDPGTESCDFRGDKFIGKDQGDHHRTVFEIDPAPDDLIDKILQFGPIYNGAGQMGELLEILGLDKDKLMAGISLLMGEHSEGNFIGLRAGIWDN